MSQRLVQQVAEKAIAPVHSCRVLGLSRSDFYATMARPARNGPSILPHLRATFEASGQALWQSPADDGAA